jgi:hypothetical protein
LPNAHESGWDAKQIYSENSQGSALAFSTIQGIVDNFYKFF